MEKQGIVTSEQPTPEPQPRKGIAPANPSGMSKAGAAACCGGACKPRSISTQDNVANAVRDASKK